MQFRVTSNFIKKSSRKSALVALMLALFSIGCIVKLIGIQSISEALFPLVGLMVFIPVILRIIRGIKEGAQSYPTIDLDELAGTISVAHKDVVVTVDLTQIKNLRLQYKSNRLDSVIVTTSSGERLRLEGYESLETLAASLVRLTPKERITNARFYHR